MVYACYGQEAAHTEEQVIPSWIQQNAIPIHHLEAGNGIEDLEPLNQVLKEVKVVGLGEPSGFFLESKFKSSL